MTKRRIGSASPKITLPANTQLDLGRSGFGGINKSDGREHTTIAPHSRDPETGRITGIKHGPCAACGKRRIISSITRLCGVRSCISARQKRYDKRIAKRRRQGAAK